MNRKLIIAALVALLYLYPAAFGKESQTLGKTVSPITEYIRDVWTTNEGLPQSSVNAIVQTSDGYLWLATLGGVVRFDGVKFTVFNVGNTEGLKSDRIHALYEDRQNRLWVGTMGGLTVYSGGKFTTYTTKDGLPIDNIASVFQDRAGNVWIGTEKGLTKYADSAFVTYTKKDGLPDDPVSRISEDSEGSLWFGTSRGVVRLRNGQFTTFEPQDGLAEYFVHDIKQTSDGSLWVATNREIARFKDDRFIAYRITDDPLNTVIRCLYEDREGFLWVGTDRGLIRVVDGQISPYETNKPFSDKNIMAIAEDREGNLWVGTGIDGLSRLKAAKFTVYGTKQGLPQDNIVPITEDGEGNIWMGLTCGGLVKLRAGKFTVYTKKDGLPNECIWSLLADPDDKSLWIGTWDGGLTHFHAGRFTTYNVANSRISNNVVLALHKTPDGALWIGTGAGLNRFHNGEFTAFHKSDGLVGEDVRFIGEDGEGALLIGTTTGLSRFKDGKFTNYTTENGLRHNFVRDVYEDADSALWIGTYGGGLHRLKNDEITHFGRSDGLFDDVVSRIFEDGDGSLWMSGNRGIFRVRRQDLNDFADKRINFLNAVSYGVTDGMSSRETNGGGQPAGWKAQDNRLWFPTLKGAVVIDPAQTKTNELPPPVVIESALANRDEIERPARIELPPGNSDLEVRYAGLSFVAPEKVRFKYRLEGYDDEWIEAGTRRTAYYTSIPPGSYLFRVVAANNDGVWNTEGATLSLIVVPPFWRTWWFTALALLAVGGIAFWAYKFRVLRLRRAHAAQAAFSRQLIESQEAERKRIAAELHDSLGQNLLVIKNRALLGLNFSNGGENRGKAVEQFDEIAASATQALGEVREISYNLHPYHLDRLGLTDAVEAMIERVAEASGINFTSEIDDVNNLFSKQAEINFYRVVQESVNNIIKHSGASEASVEIKRDERAVHLTVGDNGRGFTLENVSSGRGFGLTGIAERVQILGGTHTISSAPGEGTTIKVNIVLPVENRDYEIK